MHVLEWRPVLVMGLGTRAALSTGPEEGVHLKLMGLGILGAYDPNDYMKNGINKKEKRH